MNVSVLNANDSIGQKIIPVSEKSLCIHNGTSDEESALPPFVQCLFGFIGNIVAIMMLVYSSKQHKWKPFHRLVCALALTDIIISVMVYPVVLKTYVTTFEYCFSKFECFYVAFLYSFSWLGSAMLVTALSFDRLLAIVFPFYYTRTSKYKRANIMILGSWTSCALVCMLLILVIGKVKIFYADTWCFIDFTDKNIGSIIATYIYACLGLSIFAATVVMNSVVIITMIRRIAADRKSTAFRKRVKSDIYIVLFLLTVVLALGVCWTPLLVCKTHGG